MRPRPHRRGGRGPDGWLVAFRATPDGPPHLVRNRSAPLGVEGPLSRCPLLLDYVAVLPDQRYGLIQPRGRVTVDTILEAGLALATDADWRAGFTEVWDVRFSPTVEILPGDIPKLIDLERRTQEALVGSTTLVVTHKPLLLYSVKFYAQLAKPFGRLVLGLGSAGSAADFLGIDRLPDLQDD